MHKWMYFWGVGLSSATDSIRLLVIWGGTRKSRDVEHSDPVVPFIFGGLRGAGCQPFGSK
jgi:hypothetical protein